MSNVPAAPLGDKRTVRIQWAPSAAPRIRKELVEDLVAREVVAAGDRRGRDRRQ